MTKKILIAKIHFDASQLDDAVIEAWKTMLRFNMERSSDALMPFIKADFATHVISCEDPNLARSPDEIANAMTAMLAAYVDEDEDEDDEITYDEE
jgi:hypothetical protein